VCTVSWTKWTNEERVRRFEQTRAADLTPELRQAVIEYLGQRLLAEIGDRPIGELESALQEEIRDYLEEQEYFIDPDKKRRYLQTRLADLSATAYEGMVRHRGHELEGRIGGRMVAELEDEVRRALRRYLDKSGYFVDEEELQRFARWTLADLRREESEELAFFLGCRRLDKKLRIADLPEGIRERVREHLRAEGYFMDRDKLARFRQQRVADLPSEARQVVLDLLRQAQVETLRERRIVDLDRETQLSIQRFLRERGFALGEAEMEPFKGRRLADLEPALYNGLVRYLGQRWLERIEDRKIADLSPVEQRVIRDYLGRRVMHQIEKNVLLHTISHLWISYLTDIEDLRQGIGLVAFGQRDPLVEYKRRAFQMFGELRDQIRRTVVASIFRTPPQPLKLAKAGTATGK